MPRRRSCHEILLTSRSAVNGLRDGFLTFFPFPALSLLVTGGGVSTAVLEQPDTGIVLVAPPPGNVGGDTNDCVGDGTIMSSALNVDLTVLVGEETELHIVEVALALM